MRIKTDLTGLGVLALAQHSFASSIFQPSQATTTTVQQLAAEEQATYPTPIPVPVPINSEFNENWSPSSDQTGPEAGYTTLAVMVTIYPPKSSARESTTSSTSTSANIAQYRRQQKRRAPP